MLLPPECCICKELLKKDLCVEKQCGNVFHRHCFKTWLTVKDKCPLCQTKCIEKNILDIHYELVKGNLIITEDNLLEKDKEELYAQLKKYEEDLQIAQKENEQKSSQIYTLGNKTTILEETLKGMEVKKLKLQMELNSSKTTSDEYIKENYILKSQIKEYEKELQKMKTVNLYLEKLSKEESNNIYVTLELNTLTEKEQIKVLLNYIKTIKDLNKNYKSKIEELKQTVIEKTQQLLQTKSEHLDINFQQNTFDTKEKTKEKEKEQERKKEKKKKLINEEQVEEVEEDDESDEDEEKTQEQGQGQGQGQEQYKKHESEHDLELELEEDDATPNKDNTTMKIKRNSFRRTKRGKHLISNTVANKMFSNNLRSDFSSNFSGNFLSNFSNSNSNISISDNTFSRSYMDSVINSSHSPTIKIHNENKTAKNVDFMDFLDKKMNINSPIKSDENNTSPKKKLRKSNEIDMLKKKSVEGLFDDVIGEGEGEGDGEGDENLMSPKHLKYKSSNSSFMYSSFDTTSNKTPSPPHPNTDFLFERINDTTPLCVEYTTPKRHKKNEITPKRKVESGDVENFNHHIKMSSSERNSSSNVENEKENETTMVRPKRPFKQYFSAKYIKKINANRRKTYAGQSSKITDFFRKV